jgi:hydrogenase expression/formation protein HypE
MRIKGVLFDFDGTLTCPGALDFPAIKLAMNCPRDMPILEYLDTLSPEERAPLQEILEAEEDEAARASVPNRGAEALLAALMERGFLIGILTRNSLKSVHLALEGFRGVRAEDFTAIVTRDDSLPKPHPDGVHQAARRMGISTSEMLVVGDFRFDVISGLAAGATTVLLANREKSVMAPGDPAPDYTVKSLEDIPRILWDG